MSRRRLPEHFPKSLRPSDFHQISKLLSSHSDGSTRYQSGAQHQTIQTSPYRARTQWPQRALKIGWHLELWSPQSRRDAHVWVPQSRRDARAWPPTVPKGRTRMGSTVPKGRRHLAASLGWRSQAPSLQKAPKVRRQTTHHPPPPQRKRFPAPPFRSDNPPSQDPTTSAPGLRTEPPGTSQTGRFTIDPPDARSLDSATDRRPAGIAAVKWPWKQEA